MLHILGPRTASQSTISRRRFLQIGTLGLTGLSLADVWKLREAQAAPPRQNRAIILFWMAGGPSHLETYDMKPNAPEPGPFRPIQTNVPGTHVCELLPRHSRLANRFSIVRSLRHQLSVHDDASHWVQTGYPLLNARQRGQQQPAQGSVVSHLRGPNQPGMPAYVCFPEAYTSPQGFYQRASSLGAIHDPVNGGGDPSLGNYRRADFSLPADLSIDRLEHRRDLARRFDAMRRWSDRATEGMEVSQQRAYDLITGPQVRAAFDLTREAQTVRGSYGEHFWGQSALLARRLVEAGVTFVTINLYERDVDWWDDHSNLEANLRRRLPPYDQALSALLEDLHARGLADQVLVAAFGEFGRTPRINANAGRDHWPRAMSALLSGGGLRDGRIVGATTPDGGDPRDQPLEPGDLLATMYRVLGIDHETIYHDRLNRPMRLVESGQPIAEL